MRTAEDVFPAGIAWTRRRRCTDPALPECGAPPRLCEVLSGNPDRHGRSATPVRKTRLPAHSGCARRYWAFQLQPVLSLGLVTEHGTANLNLTSLDREFQHAQNSHNRLRRR